MVHIKEPLLLIDKSSLCDYTWNVQNGIDKSLDQYNQVIYILPEIYFTNLYRFPETENLLYILITQINCNIYIYIFVKFRKPIPVEPSTVAVPLYILPDYTD